MHAEQHVMLALGEIVNFLGIVQQGESGRLCSLQSVAIVIDVVFLTVSSCTPRYTHNGQKPGKDKERIISCPVYVVHHVIIRPRPVKILLPQRARLVVPKTSPRVIHMNKGYHTSRDHAGTLTTCGYC